MNPSVHLTLGLGSTSLSGRGLFLEETLSSVLLPPVSIQTSTLRSFDTFKEIKGDTFFSVPDRETNYA